MISDDIIFGQHAVTARLERDHAGLVEGWLQEGRETRAARRLRAAARSAGVAVHEVPREVLDRLLPDRRHQGIAVRYRALDEAAPARLADFLRRLSGEPLLLVLDGVQDPHNLGACLRTAEGAGCAGVIVPRHRAVGLTPAVRKVACGAAERVPLIAVGSLADALAGLKAVGIGIVGGDAHRGASLYETSLTGPLAMVLGGEASGLRRLTRERCDRLVRIPLYGGAESLNVSVATGVCLFEACRQRGIGSEENKI